MNSLEWRYRAALRWYPGPWVARNGEALLGTLLDVADAEKRTDPTTAELADLRINGLRQRGLEAIPPEVRSRASSIALGMGAGFAAVQFLALEWAPWIPQSHWASYGTRVGFGPFVSIGAVIDLLWVLAFISGMLGFRAGANIALLGSVATAIASYQLPIPFGWFGARPSGASLIMLALLAAVVMLANPAPDARGAGWVAISLGATLVTVAAFCSSSFPQPGLYGTQQFWQSFPLLHLGIVIALVIAGFAAYGQWAWCGAIFVALVPWWISLLLTSSGRNVGAQTIAVLLFALFLGAFAIRVVASRHLDIRRGATS